MTLPKGLTQTTGYDETGDATTLQYAQPGCTTGAGCLLLQEVSADTIHGQRTGHATAFSEQYESYDKAGRLFKAIDIRDTGCTTRTYNLDDASNRTADASYNPTASGDCQNDTPTGGGSWWYDTADRIGNDGYTYDTLGRTLTLPSTDTQNNAGDLTVGYHVTDLVRSITQGAKTSTYTLDVTGDRIRNRTDTTNGTATGGITNHYDTDTDSPSWTQETPTTYTRTTTALGATASYNSATNTVTYPITNLHGDLIADTAANLTTTPGVQAVYETTEYGTTTATDTGARRYGYLGTHQRANDNPAGITLMGIRLYNPTTGRFLTVDPVYGGSCNDYDYVCADPVNDYDLSGLWSIVDTVKKAIQPVNRAIAQTKTIASKAGKALGRAALRQAPNLVGSVVGFAVTVGCTGAVAWATGGVGAAPAAVACGALGGAIGGAVQYRMSTAKAKRTTGGYIENAAGGALVGSITGSPIGKPVAKYAARLRYKPKHAAR